MECPHASAWRGQRVGIVWSGNSTHADDHNRSIALARMVPIFDQYPIFSLSELAEGIAGC